MSFMDLLTVIEDYPATVAGVVAIVAVMVAVCSNIQSRWQYRDSNQPQLSMSLIEQDYSLYLQIKNTGGLPVKEASVTVKSIRNNGDQNELHLDALFNMQFELYPEETIQGEVAMFGASMVNHAFPQIDISVEYKTPGKCKKIVYARSVTYIGCSPDNRVARAVENVNSQIESVSRSVVRIANYLDGIRLYAFDNVNVQTEKTLREDMDDLLWKYCTGNGTEDKSEKEENIK
jgi:hypothetical protein